MRGPCNRQSQGDSRCSLQPSSSTPRPRTGLETPTGICGGSSGVYMGRNIGDVVLFCIYSFVTTLDSLHSLVAEGLNAELQRISHDLRRKVQPAGNEASLCGIFVIIPREADRPDICFEIVVIAVI